MAGADGPIQLVQSTSGKPGSVGMVFTCSAQGVMAMGVAGSHLLQDKNWKVSGPVMRAGMKGPSGHLFIMFPAVCEAFLSLS